MKPICEGHIGESRGPPREVVGEGLEVVEVVPHVLGEGEAFRSFPNALVFRWERILVAGRILSVVFYLRGVATAANREVSTNSSPRGGCTVIGP